MSDKTKFGITVTGLALLVCMYVAGEFTVDLLPSKTGDLLRLVDGQLVFVDLSECTSPKDADLIRATKDHVVIFYRDPGGHVMKSVPAGWLPRTETFPNGVWLASFPLYIPLCLFLILSVPTGHRCYLAALRRRNGMCVKCGYNLHGLPAPRCPECNTSFE